MRGGREHGPIGRPAARDLLQEPHEVRHRQVGEPEQGEPVRGEHDVERPSRTAQGGLHEPEELRVEGGVELAIDLDGDEVLVEQRRRLVVGEALALHHVAPVAGEVADGDEDQPVLGARPRNEIRAPLLPVHGIVRVQPQVRRCGVGKGIGRFVGAERRPRPERGGEQRQADEGGADGSPEPARSRRGRPAGGCAGGRRVHWAAGAFGSGGASSGPAPEEAAPSASRNASRARKSSIASPVTGPTWLATSSPCGSTKNVDGSPLSGSNGKDRRIARPHHQVVDAHLRDERLQRGGLDLLEVHADDDRVMVLVGARGSA